MKTFVIGDIHGCYRELMALYKSLPINPKKDRVIFLGDYVDRGPDSNKVVQQMMEWEKLYPHWVFLYGNHEDLMLDVLMYKGRVYDSYHLWWGQGGKETTESYIPKDLSIYKRALVRPEDVIPKDHIEWLASRPRYFEDENYIYVHAGLSPKLNPDQCDPSTLIWIRDEFINSNYDWGKKVIFGHTAMADFRPIIKDNKIGLDTAPNAPTGGLTALQLPGEIFYFQESFNQIPYES